MRRVDNIVSVLDTALKRQAATSATTARSSSAESSPPSASSPSPATAPLKPSHPGLLTSISTSTTTHATAPNARTGSSRTPPLPSSQQTPRASDTIKLIERWKAEMPTEAEMLPRDKYSMFDRKARGYRKGVHKLPKWTRVSQRLNPPGF
ncbi:hypothetical protein B0A54_08157 [Friedmanniomyces endolithicus]|uniref:54S ribosomal protein L31, mitochondrial n=1 Tax=Friedmanniomyces endolithicus TaxID=329885 RepID=A0A4U0UZM8_9PEZI|nr:hypothetical protein B0A54_08157 [Friedmanniomyces endolithicus]